MVNRRISLPAYRRLTAVALVMVSAIIVTGAAVRLSNSGLGCTDWPRCSTTKLVSVSNLHQAIEQFNRLFTGLLVLATAAAVLASFLLVPRRRDLTRLALLLVAGVFGNAVLGGISVLTDLNPLTVAGHLLWSMLIVSAGVVLHRRAGEPDGPRRLTVPPAHLKLVRLVVGLAAVSIVAGTVVTGSGPHGGDDKAPRFHLAITTVTRTHSLTVWFTVAALVLLMVRTRSTPSWRVLEEPVSVVVGAAVVQGAIGYTQYALGVPAAVVGVHVLGATLYWIAVMRLLLATRAPVAPVPAAGGSVASYRSSTTVSSVLGSRSV